MEDKLSSSFLMEVPQIKSEAMRKGMLLTDLDLSSSSRWFTLIAQKKKKISWSI